MAKRLPRSAERRIAGWCNYFGAVATQPDEDVHGWDLLIEFPIAKHPGSADSAPARRQAYVQIKSTVGDKLGASVKLSNMQRSAASADPWFIFLVTDDGRTYGRHIDDYLVEAALREVRIAESQGKSLIRRKLWIPFASEHEILDSADIIAWMQMHILPSAAEYSTWKTHLFKKVGFDESSVAGTFNVVVPSEEELALFFLGAGSTLKVSSASFQDVRFNIASKAPVVFDDVGTLTMEPDPVSECEVVIRTDNRLGERLAIKGKLFEFVPPCASHENMYSRVLAPPVDLILLPQSRVRLKTLLDERVQYNIPVFENYRLIWNMLRDGPITVEVRTNGATERFFPISSNEDGPPSIFLDALNAVNSVCRSAGVDDLRYSIEEIRGCFYDISIAAQLMTSGSMKVQVPRLPVETTERFTRLLYRLDFSLGDRSFSTVASRLVVAQSDSDDCITVYAGPPQLHESRVSVNAPDSDLTSGDYEEIYQHLGDTENPLGLGNVMLKFRTGTKQIDLTPE